MEAEVAEGGRFRLTVYQAPALLYLFVFGAPYLFLLSHYGFSFGLDEYTWRVLWFTLWQAALSALLSLVGGFALLPAYLKTPWVKPLALTPFFAPALSTVDALIRLHGDVMYSPWGIVIAHGVYYSPYVALLLESNMRSMPADLTEALDLYVRRLGARLKIVLWELRPSILYSLYTVFVFSFLSFTTPLLLGGRYPTLELLIYIYATSYASTALASALVALNLIATLALAVPLLRMRSPPPADPAARPPKVGPLPTAVGLAAAGYYAAVAFYIFSPLLAPRGVAEVWPYVLNSILVAVVAATGSLVLVLLFLMAEGAGTRLPGVAYAVALSLSKSVFALGFFYLAQPLYGTLLILVAAHILVISPLTFSLANPAWEKIRQDVRESCALYLGPARCVFRIVAELLGPTIVQAWLIALASSLSETTLALMLTTGASTTLSAITARLLTSRGPELVETGHFYSSLLALLVLVTVALSRLVKTRPFSF